MIDLARQCYINKMKAIQISAERQMGVVDIPEMEMKSDEVQLRLEYV